MTASLAHCETERSSAAAAASNASRTSSVTRIPTYGFLLKSSPIGCGDNAEYTSLRSAHFQRELPVVPVVCCTRLRHGAAEAERIAKAFTTENPIRETVMLPFGDADLPIFASDATRVPTRRRRWLQDEVLLLVACYPAGEPVADISKRFGRSLTAIYGKARRLGLSRPQRGMAGLGAGEALPEQIEMALSVPLLDLVPPTPAAPPFLPPVEAPAPVRKPAKPFRLTPLGGRQTVWSPDLVRRLILLWVAGFHHTAIAEVLSLTPCGVSSKAVRISLPYRGSMRLSKDATEARRVDAAGGSIPAFIVDGAGRHLIGKACNLSGVFFFAPRGTHTSVEAKLTLHYDRMRQAAF